MYHYYQVDGGEQAWKPVPADSLPRIVSEKHPMFVTVLATDKVASKDMPRDEKLNLKYIGPMYVDFDAADPADAIKDLLSFCKRLESECNLDPTTLHLFATGSKGFHVEIPMEYFVTRVDKKGYPALPLIYKAIAVKFAEDTMDWRVYSVGMGRMWRQPNVMRPNNRYKVPISWEEAQTLTAESVVEITSSPRPLPDYPTVEMNIDLAVIFDKALQDVTERMKVVKKRKPLDSDVFKRPMPSIDMMMQGKGIAGNAGFNQLAMQLAIYARETGMDETTLITKCAGLITEHKSNGNRYNTPARREAELLRMHRVVYDDPCYEYAAEPIRALLTHAAPDLDGLTIDPAEIAKDIEEAAAAPKTDAEGGVLVDEYNDVAGGVNVTKYGVYVDTEFGKKRVCAVAPGGEINLLHSMDTGQLSAFEADVMVNGKSQGRQLFDPSTFLTAAGYNKFVSRYGHAFQGTEQHVRAAFMRSIEQGRKTGGEVFVHEREGLALVSIPHHANEAFRKPFLIWSDGKKVVMEPRVTGLGVTIQFRGNPNPRGVFRCDLMDAPVLQPWLTEPGNADRLKLALTNLFCCQRPDMIGPMMGWLVACFYKSIFQKAYNQFPILHIAGAAGSGKSQMSAAMAKLFYYTSEPKSVSPSSTVFAITQFASGSDSIPMIVDEYKPQDMTVQMHDKLKLMFRDSYNAREIQRGGGNRDNDDYRSISTTTLTSPIVFIAEGVEAETALMERVVLVTVAPPPSVIKHKWATRFHAFHRDSNLLALLGRYIAVELVSEGYDVDRLHSEFDPMYEAARAELMMTEEAASLNLTPQQISARSAAQERSVYNFTIAKFGLAKLQKLLDEIFPDKPYEEDFKAFNAAAYARMEDLRDITIPEYLKVLNVMVDLSYEEPTLQQALRCGFEYGFGNVGGRDTIELNARAAYNRYRQHCRLINLKPLYAGEQAFSHALRNVSSLKSISEGQMIQSAGGTHIFDAEDLMRVGLRGFNEPRGRRS